MSGMLGNGGLGTAPGLAGPLRKGAVDMVLLDASGGYEDALRSLGAFLDAHQARAVSIREVAVGLIVRAQMVGTVDDRLGGRWRSLERTFGANAIEAERRAARERRGTGHVAGPIERSLRLLGRQADDRRLGGLTIIQHHVDDGWLVWHDGKGSGSPELFSMSAGELGTLDAIIRSQVGREPMPVGEF